tara:strand:- start:15832 stop:16257 length:426 start_codon:yes stop_codon:yes gene_type:complete
MNLIKRVMVRASRELKRIKGYSNTAGKVFCVGRNKFGTTSINRALRDLRSRVASQEPVEWLTEKWSKRDFRELCYADFCSDPASFYCQIREKYQHLGIEISVECSNTRRFNKSASVRLDRTDERLLRDALTRFQSEVIAAD